MAIGGFTLNTTQGGGGLVPVLPRNDLVEEITYTTGLGPYTLGGPTATHFAFSQAYTGGSTLTYSVSDGDQIEVVQGIFDGIETLTRVTLLASSNTGQFIDWNGITRPLVRPLIGFAPPAVTPPPPPPVNPTPVAITLVPTDITVGDNTLPGTVLSSIFVSMSDGSIFAGTTRSSDDTGTLATSGLVVILDRALTAADDGKTFATVITASQNLVSVSAPFSLKVQAP